MKGFCWTCSCWRGGVSRRDRPCVGEITFGSPAMRPQMRPQTDMINALTPVWDSIVCAGSDREKESEQLKRERRWRAWHYSNASSAGKERPVYHNTAAVEPSWRHKYKSKNETGQDYNQPTSTAHLLKNMFRLAWVLLVLFNMSQWLSLNVLERFSRSYKQRSNSSINKCLYSCSVFNVIIKTVIFTPVHGMIL